MTSVLIMDWKTVLLPVSMPPGFSPVGWYSHVESKNIIHSYMRRGNEKGGAGVGGSGGVTGDSDSVEEKKVIKLKEGGKGGKDLRER